MLNDSKARVHTVNGTFFLVTPGIFQRYAAVHSTLTEADSGNEGWRIIQLQFEKLNVHMKNPCGQNIWTCKVQGARRTTLLHGYILRKASNITSNILPDNPFLILSIEKPNDK